MTDTQRQVPRGEPGDETAQKESAEEEPVEKESVEEESVEKESVEKEWWDDPSLPWQHKPGRADWACMAWIGFMSLFGLAMLPLKGWLLGLNPQLNLALSGSRSGVTAVGALARVGEATWWGWALLAGSLMSIKFDWVFWWAGKLWGRGIIEVWAGRSARAQKNYARAERWAQKMGWLGMFAAYIPIPLPLMQVIFVLAGSARMSLRRFLMLDFLASTTWLLFFFGLGYLVGEPAVAVLKEYAKVANVVAIALVVLVMISVFWNSSRKAAAPPANL